jgi:hypothetical protein
MTTDSLFLQPHAFLCRGKRHWVILDCARDQYHCVNRRQFEALGPLLKGWVGTAAPGGDGAAAVPADAIGLARQLLQLDILSEGPTRAKDARALQYPLPTEALDIDSPAGSRWLACVHAGSFFASAARASRELREKRFHFIIEQVRERKAARGVAFELERAVLLASVFDRLRPYYAAGYDCLPDSLRLIHFLARFGVFPDWVFGVIADPFEAHCWVQAGSVVLNDRAERVSAFTPIMHI